MDKHLRWESSVLWKIPIAEIFSWAEADCQQIFSAGMSQRHGTSGLINLHKIKTLQLNFQQNKTR